MLYNEGFGLRHRHALADPLCLMYYPMRRKRYWWSIVMLLRPTPIAIFCESYTVADTHINNLYYIMFRM